MSVKERTLELEPGLDVALSLRGLASIVGGLPLRVRGHEALRSTRTPEGPATVHLRQDGQRLDAEAWGPGANWLLECLPGLVGSLDQDAHAFAPAAEPVRGLHRRMPGLRLVRTRAVFETLLPVIVTQKVVGKEASRSLRLIIERWGEPAPGPGGLRLPPAPELLAGLAYEEFHPLGIEKRRADTLVRAASRARRLEEIVDLRSAEAYTRLTSLRGIGPWTAGKVLAAALGDPDAVHLGDYHLPSLVAWNLAGEPRADDARMLELLEPYSGQRGRVVRLLELGGATAPRYGPRLEFRRIERY